MSKQPSPSPTASTVGPFPTIWGWLGSAMVLGKLPVPGRPTIWMIVGQGPIALAVGAGGGCLNIFSSPEHKVLKVSYCDHPVSGVRRQSSVVCRQQFIQSTSPPKLLDQFQNNFTQMFP